MHINNEEIHHHCPDSHLNIPRSNSPQQQEGPYLRHEVSGRERGSDRTGDIDLRSFYLRRSAPAEGLRRRALSFRGRTADSSGESGTERVGGSNGERAVRAGE
ncbi:hypothetical protein BT93_J0181 [Corymbia citriodora subsp. variegata]|nr:hypothetical protein BT93_J0181 [Corymbia citriodora subsp. variegata]